MAKQQQIGPFSGRYLPDYDLTFWSNGNPKKRVRGVNLRSVVAIETAKSLDDVAGTFSITLKDRQARHLIREMDVVRIRLRGHDERGMFTTLRGVVDTVRQGGSADVYASREDSVIEGRCLAKYLQVTSLFLPVWDPQGVLPTALIFGYGDAAKKVGGNRPYDIFEYLLHRFTFGERDLAGVSGVPNSRFWLNYKQRFDKVPFDVPFLQFDEDAMSDALKRLEVLGYTEAWVDETGHVVYRHPQWDQPAKYKLPTSSLITWDASRSDLGAATYVEVIPAGDPGIDSAAAQALRAGRAPVPSAYLKGGKFGDIGTATGSGAGTTKGPKHGQVSGDRAATQAAASKYGVPFYIMWGIYGAESSWGKASNWFGLVSVPRTGSFAGDAAASAKTMQRLYRTLGHSWERAMRAYSGNGYGLKHIEDLVGGPRASTPSTASPSSSGGDQRPNVSDEFVIETDGAGKVTDKGRKNFWYKRQRRLGLRPQQITSPLLFTQEQAQAQAEGLLQFFGRMIKTFSGTIPGYPSLRLGENIRLHGELDGLAVDRTYYLDQVSHSYVESSDGGSFTTSFRASHGRDPWDPKWGTIAIPKFDPAKLSFESGTLDPGGGGDISGATIGSDELKKFLKSGPSPKEIIDRVVLPIARAAGAHTPSGASLTPSNNDAANHAHTHLGSASDHAGPPSYKWAADCSIGPDTRGGANPSGKRIGDKIARALSALFDVPSHGLNDSHAYGYRFQLIWQYEDPQAGNHYNHVHFGVRKGG